VERAPVTRLVAIHQPTFLPWLGWWDKLVRADVLVLLDDVQFPKKGGTWMNRVKLLVGGRPAWVTVPVDRAYHGVRTVRETAIDESTPWRRTLRQTLATSYGRSPAYSEAADLLDAVLETETRRLVDLNERAIQLAAQQLGLDTHKLVRQSDVGVAGTGTALLVDLCRAVDGDAYLTGDGAGGYLEGDLFERAQLQLVEQKFVPPVYLQQVPEHVPGLSFVDAVANIGWQATSALVEHGAPRPP